MIFSPHITKAIQELTQALESEGFMLEQIIIDEQVITLLEIEV